MVQWKMAEYLKGNDPIGDTPIFHWTMIMGGRVCSIRFGMIAMEKGSFEDIFPIEYGRIPASYVSLPKGTPPETNISHAKMMV